MKINILTVISPAFNFSELQNAVNDFTGTDGIEAVEIQSHKDGVSMTAVVVYNEVAKAREVKAEVAAVAPVAVEIAALAVEPDTTLLA